MTLRLFNTLTRQVEEFAPLAPPRVTLYTCGPTVWNYAHIGNFRTFVFEDVLRRYLEYAGYQVTHVMNLTDVDDRTIAAANKAGVSLARTPRRTSRRSSRTATTCGSSRPRTTRARPRTSRRWWR